MNRGDVPKHMEVAARTGFINSVNALTPLAPYTKFVDELKIDSATGLLVDVGSAPMPEEETDQPVGDFTERYLNVEPKNFPLTVWISYNATKDDQTRQLERKVKAAGENYVKHKNNLVFQTLNGGDGATYGLGYDGQFYFDTDHVDAGAEYSTAQSNLKTLALNNVNFLTVMAAAELFKDDKGEFANHKYDMIITDPTNLDAAAQIAKNVEKAGTGNRDINPFAGQIDYLTSPHFDTGSWVLLKTGGSQKPLIYVNREMPHLQHTWFDPKAPDGGRYYFKFYARYNVHYGDWRLGIMGKT